MRLRFDRHELAGSLGDLGTLLPLAIGLIQINGLDATAVLLMVGLYFLASGAYFGITMPVQPMKVVSAYAIAAALEPTVITTSGFLLGVLLMALALTSAIDAIGTLVPKPVIRGVQLSTGVLLLSKGVHFIVGDSEFQTARGAAEPFLDVQSIGPVPIGVVLGAVAFTLIFLLLRNKVAPAALVVVIGGLATGLALGGLRALSGLSLGINLPTFLPYGTPTSAEVVVALTVLALPQVPMTIGNAVLAQADLTKEYFGEAGARRSTPRALTLSMGLANLASALVGGMPMCHGAGGLAAHYQFGARTAGSNIIIGTIFVAVAITLGSGASHLLGLLPLSVLGALLAYAGVQLALVILDVTERRDLFVVVMLLGISLATNLAVGFVVGIILAYALRHPRVEV